MRVSISCATTVIRVDGPPEVVDVEGAPVLVQIETAEGPVSGRGMRLAEHLVAVWLDVPRSRVRVAALDPSGRPVAFVAGVPGPGVTISHADGLLAAAVGDVPVGIDVVAVAAATPALERFLAPAERARLVADDRQRERAWLWAAKEAAYKAAAVDAGFRPLDYCITPAGDGGFTWIWRQADACARGVGHILDVSAPACGGRPPAAASAAIVAVATRGEPGSHAAGAACS